MLCGCADVSPGFGVLAGLHTSQLVPAVELQSLVCVVFPVLLCASCLACLDVVMLVQDSNWVLGIFEAGYQQVTGVCLSLETSMWCMGMIVQHACMCDCVDELPLHYGCCLLNSEHN